MNDRNDYYPSPYPRQGQDRYDRLQALEAQFMQLQSMPMQYGVVVRVIDKPQDPKRPSLPQKLVTVSCAQGLLEFDRQNGFEAEYGDTVRLATTPQGLGIFDRTPSSGVPIGVSATVTTIFHDGIAEVDAAGLGARTVFYSIEHTPNLKVGAKVILDQYGKAILYADVVSAKSQFSFEEDTNVSWDDIGGLYDAKRLLREAIELSRDYRGLYESYGKKPIRGILLAGPPGCLAGDTKVKIIDGKLGFKITDIKTLVEMKQKPNTVVFVERVENHPRVGVICTNVLVHDAWSSGVKDTFELVTYRGLRIRATADHRFMVQTQGNEEEQYKALRDLKVGDTVCVAPYGVPVSDDTIVSITPKGQEEVFDIEVHSSPHNFIANGFVVHNCGKTMLAKATATALHETYGASAYGGFFYVKGPALVEKYAGVGEAKVRELFAAAREFERKNGPTLIAEMDGMEHSSSLVIAATNKPKHLDAAIVRSGRMNYTVYVDRPNEVVTTDILALNLARVHCYTKPSDGVIGVSGLAKATSDYVFDDRHDVVAHQTSVGPIALKLKHLLNGALIADIVEKASSLAMHRDIDAKLTEATGVGLADLKTAVEQTVKEESVKNHEDVVSELVGQMMRRPTKDGSKHE